MFSQLVRINTRKREGRALAGTQMHVVLRYANNVTKIRSK